MESMRSSKGQDLEDWQDLVKRKGKVIYLGRGTRLKAFCKTKFSCSHVYVLFSQQSLL
jgi:hypothetical protein